MNEATRCALLALNRAFYAENAREFDASRASPWRGFARISEALPRRVPLRVLDLGCGNGRLLGHLADTRAELQYVGIDSCGELLASAARRFAGHAGVRFHEAELLDASGTPQLPDERFDCVALMGVLHHVPSERARRALVQAALERVAGGGLLVFTVWRFAHHPRFLARRAPWSEVEARFPEIDTAQLEAGDALLRWSTRPGALRYCHAADSDEIERWLRGTRAEVSRFRADGRGELNEYVLARQPD